MILLPELLVGLLRLGSAPETGPLIANDPLILAAHYALVGERLCLPEATDARLGAVRTRYLEPDAVLEWMDSLRGQLPQSVSVDLGRRLAEGMALQGLLTSSPGAYARACTAALPEAQTRVAVAREVEGLGTRLRHLGRRLELSATEQAVLSFGFTYAANPALAVFTRLMVANPWHRRGFWTTLFDCPEAELRTALAPRSRLLGARLLESVDGIPRLADFWIEAIVRGDGVDVGSLTVPLTVGDAPDGAARLPEEDRTTVVSLLSQATAADGLETSRHVLLYGRAGIDKRRLAAELIAEAGGHAYTLASDIPDDAQPSALLVARKLLSREVGSPVLVIPQAASLLARRGSARFLFFGLDAEGEGEDEPQGLDAQLLGDSPIPMLWLCQDPGRLHRETVARFLFHAEVHKGTRAQRQALVAASIDGLALDEADKERLAELPGVSLTQLERARMVAALTAPDGKNYAKRLILCVQRSQKALDRREKDGVRTPVTRYDLDYLHTAGRFGPRQILTALQRNPRGSLCLYGLPGTGKTQFAEQVALHLGKPLLRKHASELLDKYVGESEKRIAEAFDQAEDEGAVLLFDEADSFLRDRQRSERSWEVTLVNEVLQRMEACEEVFMATTNLMGQMDAAALRRFTFKLEFLPLRLEQRWAMFVREAGLKESAIDAAQRELWEERLALMRDLTPGDFATVKRQCLLLGETLTAEDWLGQLDMEVRAKGISTEPARAS